jgi:hypothetical protein
LNLTFALLPGKFAICRLDPDAEIPQWAMRGEFFSITRTSDEISIVCGEPYIVGTPRCERGWRCLKLEGPFAFSEVGVISSITAPIAEAGVSLFALATFDTDYLLIKDDLLEDAIGALLQAGHKVRAD